MATATVALNIGTVVQVIGPVLDVEFEPGHLPEIYNALLLEDAGAAQPIRLVAEVQQHIGQNQVRAVAMSTTDGVVRPPSAFGTTTGSPPSMTAMHEFVVPKSMPKTFAIKTYRIECRDPL